MQVLPSVEFFQPLLPPLAPFVPMQLLHTVDRQIRQLTQQRQASDE